MLPARTKYWWMVHRDSIPQGCLIGPTRDKVTTWFSLQVHEVEFYLRNHEYLWVITKWNHLLRGWACIVKIVLHKWQWWLCRHTSFWRRGSKSRTTSYSRGKNQDRRADWNAHSIDSDQGSGIPQHWDDYTGYEIQSAWGRFQPLKTTLHLMQKRAPRSSLEALNAVRSSGTR